MAGRSGASQLASNVSRDARMEYLQVDTEATVVKYMAKYIIP